MEEEEEEEKIKKRKWNEMKKKMQKEIQKEIFFKKTKEKRTYRNKGDTYYTTNCSANYSSSWWQS
jgi:hypothetical protein